MTAWMGLRPAKTILEGNPAWTQLPSREADLLTILFCTGGDDHDPASGKKDRTGISGVSKQSYHGYSPVRPTPTF